MFSVCNHDQHDTSKTLTIGNQSEVSIKQYNTVTCFSSIETISKVFMIPFAVPDIKHIVLGTPFFEKSIQINNKEDLTMNFKHSFNDQHTIASITTLIEKNLPFFSFNC